MTRRPSYPILIVLIVCGVLATSRPTHAQTADTFSAHARMADDINITTARSVEVTFVINHYTTDAEHAAATAALKQDSDSLHALFRTTPDVGQILVNGKTIPLKYAYRHATPQAMRRTAENAAASSSRFLLDLRARSLALSSCRSSLLRRRSSS